jgi:hypothetical protein
MAAIDRDLQKHWFAATDFSTSRTMDIAGQV